jgi:hypothetical protein
VCVFLQQFKKKYLEKILEQFRQYVKYEISSRRTAIHIYMLYLLYNVHVCMCVCMYGIFFQYFLYFFLWDLLVGTLTATLLHGGHLCYPICFSYRRVLGKDSNLEPSFSLFRYANHLAPLHPSSLILLIELL